MSQIDDFNKLIDKISKEVEVRLPEGFGYRYAPYSCWKCDKDIIIFKWCHSRIEGEIKTPSEPIPKTIQKRHTAMANQAYWANVCPHCDSVQGDFFLSNEPDSPFFVLHNIENTKEAYEADMVEIVDYYYSQIQYEPTNKETTEGKPNHQPEQKRFW